MQFFRYIFWGRKTSAKVAIEEIPFVGLHFICVMQDLFFDSLSRLVCVYNVI